MTLGPKNCWVKPRLAKLPEAQRYWLHVLGTLNEAQARVFVAQKALEEGRGGVSRLARLTGMSRPTILKGMAELEAGRLALRADKGRIRAVGGGRKRLDEADPHIKRVLARLVEAFRTIAVVVKTGYETFCVTMPNAA